jgi:hypothetical protein
MGGHVGEPNSSENTDSASDAIVGTDVLGRPLTDAEKRRFERVLRKHDYVGARMVALRFAHSLTKNLGRAQDVMGRADLRLVRFGWDPAQTSLVKRLCRLVWSESTNAKNEAATARAAEAMYQREMEVSVGTAEKSVEARAIELEAERALQKATKERAESSLVQLRTRFEAAGDEVNLLWLEWAQKDVVHPADMAQQTGRDVDEFYRAAERRKRHVQALLDAQAEANKANATTGGGGGARKPAGDPKRTPKEKKT